MRLSILALVGTLAALPLTPVAAQEPKLEIVASSETAPMNGVAVLPNGRTFVSMPRWQDWPIPSFAEITKDGLMPYPGGAWNTWKPGDPVLDRFVNVNGVQVHDGDLWVVDSGGPFLGPQVQGSAKLVRIDPDTNKIVRVYPFGPDLIPANGYLNDVRFDPDGKTAYLAESGSGALYVLNLESGKARRLLAGTKPTLWTEGVVAKVEGRELRTPDGGVVKIHADQIEISPDGQTLYFQALSGPLYKIPTTALKDTSLDDAALLAQVEKALDTPPLGGLSQDQQGRFLLSELETNALTRIEKDGSRTVLVQDPELVWPDAPFLAGDGYVYVPAAQASRMAPFQAGVSRLKPPYKLFRIRYQP